MRRHIAPLLLLALVAAPAARGEAPTLGVEPFRFPLAPTPEGHRTLLSVDAACGHDVAIGFEDAPHWATILVEPQTLPSPPCEGRWQDAAALIVHLAQDAPALERATLRILARAGGEEGRVEVPLTVAFVNELTIVANETEKVAKPQEAVVFEVRVTSRGNGNAKVALQLAQEPVGAQVPLPPSVTLQPGTSTTVPITVQTPYRNGPMDETATFSVRFASSYALDPAAKGDEETLVFTVHTRGTYVPAPAQWGLLLACACLALLLRRGR